MGIVKSVTFPFVKLSLKLFICCSFLYTYTAIAEPYTYVNNLKNVAIFAGYSEGHLFF